MIVAKGSNAILNSLSNVDNGAIGEYICALRLLKMGVQCRIVNMGTSDIIAELDGRIYRIQVKSSQLKPRYETERSSSGYQFITSKGGKKTRLTEDDCDIVAMVALDLENIWFSPIHKAAKQISKRIHPSKFCEDTIEKTWKDTISYLDNL